MAHDAQFRDRRAELFGRESFIAELLERAKTQGATALIGKPLSGKTWLLQEFSRRLSLTDGAFRALPELGAAEAMVGYYESAGDAPDVLLRCLSDLYTRWLGSASAKVQVKTLLERHRDDLSGTVGGIVGGILKFVASLSVPTWSDIAKAVDTGLGSLLTLDTERKTGGLTLSVLTYDQARELINVLTKLNNRNIVLILDSWEKVPQLEMQKDLLDKYLHHPEEWPRTHIFLGIRREKDDDPVVSIIKELELNPGLATRELGSMDLDAKETARMLVSLREQIPVAKSLEDMDILEMIGSQPGVLYRWRTSHPTSSEQLAALARDARYYSYPELHDALNKLTGPAAALAARLAVLPPIKDPADWRRISDLILAPSDGAEISNLELQGVLTGESEFPSYGHSTRHEAARTWYMRNPRGMRYAKQETEFLISKLLTKARVSIEDVDKYRLIALIGRTFQDASGVNLRNEYSLTGKAAVVVTRARSGLGQWLADLFGGWFEFIEDKPIADVMVFMLLEAVGKDITEETPAERLRLVAEGYRVFLRMTEGWDAESRKYVSSEDLPEKDRAIITKVVGDWLTFLNAASESNFRIWATAQLPTVCSLHEQKPDDVNLLAAVFLMEGLALAFPANPEARATRDMQLAGIRRTANGLTHSSIQEAVKAAHALAMEDEFRVTGGAGLPPRDAIKKPRAVFQQEPKALLEPYADFLQKLFKSPTSREWRLVVLEELRDLASNNPGSRVEISWAEAELLGI